tara:strand:+ start:125161 stop:126234 length:1074 start_codon:yes stop_codon:yes gene_type:complete
MRGVHVFIAFTLAVVLMTGAYYAVWQYSMMRTVHALPEILSETMPGVVKFNNIEVEFHPFHPTVTLKDTTIVMRDSKTGGSVVVSMGDVKLDVVPFELRKINVQVPENITIVTTHKNRSHDYRVNLIEPTLELNKVKDNYNAIISVSGMIVKGRQKGFFSNIIKSGYSYISKDIEPGEWAFMFNNLDLRALPAFKKTDIIRSLSAVWYARGLRDFPAAYVVSAAGAKDKVVFDSMLMDVFNGMAEKSKITVNEARLAYDDTWYSYKGDVELDEGLYIEAQGVLSTNKFADMLGGIKDIMGGFPIALTYMMDSIGAGENKTQSIDVGVEKRIMTINGAPVGVMDTVPELIHLHGRGIK